MKLYLSENKYDNSIEFAKICLSSYSGSSADTFNISKDQYGKPYLTDNICSLQFSLSHSHGLIVCVVAEFAVGIDCESVDIDVLRCRKIASRFYHADELSLLNKTFNDREYVEKFIEIWTKKEAYVKFTGKGLSQGLRTFSVYDKNIGVEYITTEYKNTHKISVCKLQNNKL